MLAATAVASPVPPAGAAAVTFYSPADGVFHVVGHGYGHGHGLSQWGAYGGAMSGASYRSILTWYYGSATFGTAGGLIKVGITSDGRNGDGTYDAVVKPAPGLQAVDAAGHSLVLPAADATGAAYDLYRAVLAQDKTFRVQGHSGGHWRSLAPTGSSAQVTDWTGWIRLSAGSGTDGVLTLVRPNGNLLYRETIELDETSGGAGVTVNRLSLEHYLAGVVSSEMPCSWTPTVNGTKRLDALEAQTVAARSYAAWRRNNPRSSFVDIVDSTADQAYHGYSAERTATSECPWTNADGSTTSASVAAINATAGQVMVDGNGRPIFAQYSASNGGFETAGSQSYLPSRPDAWDGVATSSANTHTWTDSFTAGSVQAVYPSIGTLTGIAVNARESLRGTDQDGRDVTEQWGGRITSLTLTGTTSSVTTSGAAFAGALGLKSPWFTVVVQRPGAPQAVTAVPGDAQAVVRWSPPASDGGGGIRGYTITASPSVPSVSVGPGARSAVVTGLANDTSYTFSVAATNTAGTGAAGAGAPVTPSARVVFTPLTTTRILDTRSHGGAVRAGTVRSVRVTGVGGVPSADVVDVAIDVVTLDSTAAGHLYVYPHGAPRPPTPQLSWSKGERLNSLVFVKVGSGGLVDIASSATTQLFVDVEGWFAPATSAGNVLSTTNPSLLLDTRSSGPIGDGGVRSFQVTGRGGMPVGATAAVLGVTAAHPKVRDYVRVWGDGTPKPGAQAFFAPAGRYSDATVIVPLSDAGTASISPTKATNVVVTLLGWFTPSSAPSSGVVALQTPVRRAASMTIKPRTTTVVRSGVPSSAGSVLLTVTATGPAGAPVTVWPTGSSQPPTTLHLRGATVPTSLTIALPTGSGGRVAVRNSSRSSVRVTVDTVGSAVA
jgi:SpoIID/LytB domain protein